MCTPSSSKASKRALGLPVRRYLLTLLVAMLLFIGLSMLQQQEAFLPLFGVGRDQAMKAGHKPADMAGEHKAKEIVIRFNSALQAAYRTGSTANLPASDMVKMQTAQVVQFSKNRKEPPPTLKAQRIIRVTSIPPADWTVISEELWSWAGGVGPASQSRLRYRYTLVPTAKGLRVEEMKPMLPEPRRAHAR
ncbi:MAG: hypothetical protein JRH20_16350 [Deltaproteobacteria bacterium]|nr:hypothetical protein [Deltaproteobacteria bacterium]